MAIFRQKKRTSLIGKVLGRGRPVRAGHPASQQEVARRETMHPVEGDDHVGRGVGKKHLHERVCAVIPDVYPTRIGRVPVQSLVTRRVVRINRSQVDDVAALDPRPFEPDDPVVAAVGSKDEPIGASAAIEPVIPDAARQHVLAVATVESVVPGATRQSVSTRAAEQSVVAGITGYDIGASAAINAVMVGATIGGIVAVAHVDSVVARPAVSPVVAGVEVIGRKPVVAGAADERVVSRKIEKRVVAGAAVSDVVAGTSAERVVSGCAGQDVIARPAENVASKNGHFEHLHFSLQFMAHIKSQFSSGLILSYNYEIVNILPYHVTLLTMQKTLAYFLLECFPMIVFFVAGQRFTFIEATIGYVIAMLLVVGIIGYGSRRLPYLSLIFGTFVLTSGLLTVIFKAPQILIFADSLYFFVGVAALLYYLHSSRSLLERLFGHTFALTQRGWRTLSYIWIGIFLVAGISNEVVRLTATPEWWIVFQFWRGAFILFLTVAQLSIAHYYRDQTLTGRWGIRH